jgi:hypothetical protein
MKTLDRRGLLRGILFGAAAAGVAFAPIAATAMPLDDTQLPGALDGWIEKTQVWVGPGPRRRPGAASTAAGGIEVAASAAGAGFNSIATLEPWL